MPCTLCGAGQNKNMILNENKKDIIIGDEEGEGEAMDGLAQTNIGQQEGNEVTLSAEQVVHLKKTLQNIQRDLQAVLRILPGMAAEEIILPDITEGRVSVAPKWPQQLGAEKIIEGAFDGQNMVGPDGKVYNVPANYASKSKLVEGDILKLTISAHGTFIFKQIDPVRRERLITVLEKHEETDEYFAALGKKRWRLLPASVSYFQCQPGDELVILVPHGTVSQWAAVENVVKKS